jgi:hypothetical protein
MIDMFSKLKALKNKGDQLQGQAQQLQNMAQSTAGLSSNGLLAFGNAIAKPLPSNNRTNNRTNNRNAQNNNQTNNRNAQNNNQTNNRTNNRNNKTRTNNNQTNNRNNKTRTNNNLVVANAVLVKPTAPPVPNSRRSGQTNRQDKNIVYVKDQQYVLTRAQTNVLAKLVDSSIRKMNAGVSHVQINKIVQNIEAIPVPNNNNKNNNNNNNRTSI